MLSVASVLEDSARRYPDRVAIITEGKRLTYAELDAAASRLAGKLAALGLNPGDRVALTSPNGAAFVAGHFGIIKAGLVTVPLNVLLTEREITYHLDDSGARAYLCHVDTPDLPLATTGAAAFARAPGCGHFISVEPDGRAAGPARSGDAPPPEPGTGFPARQRSETDTAVVLYTSGTTGRPKGAMLTHRAMLSAAESARRALELSALPETDIRNLVPAPLFHVMGSLV
jgi:long-chain acyl-CoA synthetase